ncbi:P-loop containing nucleoside triphosphate hydrolase protein, partial [Thamnocephalis sphaerospora]
MDVNDLAQLSKASADAILRTLRDRYVKDTVYARIGTRTLVSVNPCCPLSSFNDATCDAYIAEYRDTSKQLRVSTPHLYQLIAHAYLTMRRTNSDQSIVLCGETGSGKTENKKLVMRFFERLCQRSKKEARIVEQVQNASEVIEAFGHATTVHNRNASRVGTFTELAFNERGHVIGSKLLDYTLEKSRVSVLPSGERNFNIFYQLMGGATEEERQRWRLEDAAAYTYLGRALGLRQPQPEDVTAFEGLRSALKSVGLGKKAQSQVFRCLAGILHLGNVQFTNPSRQTTEESAYVRNDDVLANAAELFGLHARALEGVLTYKTQLIKSEMCTLFLNADQCTQQRDDLARSLYGLLFSWLVEQINSKLCAENQTCFIGVLDLIGYQPDRMARGGTGLNFEAFLANFACERVHNFMLHEIFRAGEDEMAADGVRVPQVNFVDNAPCLDLFMKPRRGLFALMDKEASRAANIRPVTDDQFMQAFNKQHSEHDNYLAVPNRHNAFAVQHFAGQVTYDVDRFAEKNADLLSADFLQLFLGNGGDLPGSANAFMTGLFEGKSVETEAHARDAGIIVAARQSAKPTRSPSTRRMRKADNDDGDGNDTDADDSKGGKKGRKATRKEKASKVVGVGTQCSKGIGELVDTLGETLPWFVLCVRPNDQGRAGQFDTKHVRAQTLFLQLAEIAQRRSVEYTINCTHSEFLDRYAIVLAPMGIESSRKARAKIEAAAVIFGWTQQEMFIGQKRVWLSDSAWRDLEDNLRAAENEARRRQKNGGADDNMSTYSGMTGYGGSGAGGSRRVPSAFFPSHHSRLIENGNDSAIYSGSNDNSYTASSSANYTAHYRIDSNVNESSISDDVDKSMLEEEEVEEMPEMTGQRRRWLCCTWSLTWWIPSSLLFKCGKMKRKDIQMAWREKVALCLLIFFASLAMLFFVIVFGNLICPSQNVHTLDELSKHDAKSVRPLTAIRGEVFDLTRIPSHTGYGVSYENILQSNKFAGKDASEMFPQQLSTQCDRFDGTGIPITLSMQNRTKSGSMENAHDYRYYTSKEDINQMPDLYSRTMTSLRRMARVALVGWDPRYLADQAKIGDKGRSYITIDKQVFDMTDYLKLNMMDVYDLETTGNSSSLEQMRFLGKEMTQIASQNQGKDVTNIFNAVFAQKPEIKARLKVCLRNIFFVGVVDYRASFRCQFSAYALLGVSVFMALILFFKFLAALQLTARREPEDHDRFVICQVPCYTEGEESLRGTIDSLAALKYDDKRKLLFIICDGMIVGSGNDLPTPRIVLDILGADTSADPEPLAFQSLGEGMK